MEIVADGGAGGPERTASTGYSGEHLVGFDDVPRDLDIFSRFSSSTWPLIIVASKGTSPVCS